MDSSSFREIIKDHGTKTFEDLGLSCDDTALINLVVEMQEAGMKAYCLCAPMPISPRQVEEDMRKIGFLPENGLRARLLTKLTATRIG